MYAKKERKKIANCVKIADWKRDELSVDKRWTEIFLYFEKNNIPYKNLFRLIERIFFFPGTNAFTEIVFSHINKIWISEKNTLH